jgi:hydroxymethylglutaryl-CoA lyase
MDLPRSVTIREEGPREGFQSESAQIPTDDKLRLINALTETGVRQINAASFVSPKWVPQMADAEEIASRLPQKPGVEYAATYLNLQGLERALATGRFRLVGVLAVSASEAFSRSNQNRTIADIEAGYPEALRRYRELGLPAHGGIMAAFGCNFQGEVPGQLVLDRIEAQLQACAQAGVELHEVMLGDTMGWANPLQVTRLLSVIHERWPDLRLSLHFHDTRGLAVANVMAALQAGIDLLESSVGGLGGCPFAGHKGAAGNVATEEVVFLCQELGIETGIDLDRMIECARLAEEIVGHPLPSRLIRGGGLAHLRQQAARGA